MLTDWERNQLAEIERGLAEDFKPGRRAHRLIGSIGPWSKMGAPLALSCLVMLSVIGAWWAVATLVTVLGIFAVGGNSPRQRRRRALRRPNR
jgi:hypothetical protein